MSDVRRTAWKGFLPDHAIVMGSVGDSPQPSKVDEYSVMGSGNPQAELLFVIEAPDQSSEPAQRDLFDRMLAAIGLNREQVYFCNLVKTPSPDSSHSLLLRQIDSVRPKVIVALGLRAAEMLLGAGTQLAELRGGFHDCTGVKLRVTHHPGDLLLNPQLKREAWADLQAVAQELGLSIPTRGGSR